MSRTPCKAGKAFILNPRASEECKNRSSVRNLNHSRPRVEEKLINRLIQTNKKLEAMRKAQEEDEIKKLQKKPRILKKSRILAEIHERKFYSDIIDTKEPVKTDFSLPLQIHCEETLSPVPQPINEVKRKAKNHNRSHFFL
jgi:hypothetical protein